MNSKMSKAKDKSRTSGLCANKRIHNRFHFGFGKRAFQPFQEIVKFVRHVYHPFAEQPVGAIRRCEKPIRE
jgi:hypothetical protein